MANEINEHNFNDYLNKARTGNTNAQYLVSMYFFTDSPKNPSIRYSLSEYQAKEYLQKAADAGHMPAKVAYAKQKLEERHYIEAAKHFLEAVQAVPDAKTYLKEGSKIYQELLILADSTYYTRAKGDACYYVAKIHQQEWAKNEAKMLHYYEAAAQMHDVNAMGELAEIYYRGTIPNKKNYEEAFKWFKKTYQELRDDKDGYYNYILGYMIAYQQGTTESKENAISYLEKGFQKGRVAAAKELGIIFYNKMLESTPKDNNDYWAKQRHDEYKTKAINFLEAGSQNKTLSLFGECQNYLGNIYLNLQDWNRAERHYLAASEAGLSVAARNVAVLYKSKINPARVAEAVKYYTKAAQENYALAQYELALMYANGYPNLPKDVVKGLIWLLKATENGHEPAKKELEKEDSEFNHVYKLYQAAGKDIQKMQLMHQLEIALDYSFNEPIHLINALNRKRHSIRSEAIFERYEFIGDRLLNTAITTYLEDHNQSWLVGQLHDVTQALIQNQTILPVIAQKLALTHLIMLSETEKNHGITDNMLADAVEALIGAIYKDSKREDKAIKVVQTLWREYLQKALLQPPKQAASTPSIIPSIPVNNLAVIPAPSVTPSIKANGSLTPRSISFFKQLHSMDTSALDADLKTCPHHAKIQNQGKQGDTGLILELKKLRDLKNGKKINESVAKINLLINYGATWQDKNKQGQTALDIRSTLPPHIQQKFSKF